MKIRTILPAGIPRGIAPRARRFRRGAALLFLLALMPRAVMAVPFQTQSLSLQSGWNAIYLDVMPTNASPEAVFAGLPLETAWAIQDRVSSINFIQDPSEPVWNKERWAYYVSTNRLEARGNRLFAIQGGQPYLLKMNGAATWNITGTPALKKIRWQPDTYNLRGFPVDPAAPPTFVDYFKPSKAHYNSVTRQIQPIYRMSPSGQWSLVSGTTPMKAGEALWVFCKGASEYQAPLELVLEQSPGLDFGTLLDQQTLRLINRSDRSFDLALRDTLPGGSGLLVYRTFSSTEGFAWQALPSPFQIRNLPGTNQPFALGLRRSQMKSTSVDAILTLNNNAGVRYSIPLTASQQSSGSGVPAAPSLSDVGANVNASAGLWVGVATLTDVSEVHSGRLLTNGTASISVTNSGGEVLSKVPIAILRTNVSLTPRPVKSPLSQRLLVHVDGSGKARLLKEVIQMWQDGTAEPAVAGRYVLLTDESKIPQFKGVALRDGELAGRRFSTVSYDFPSEGGKSHLSMNGSFAIGSTLNVGFTLPADHPTNPFRHKYHPDHNNLEESFAISRFIELQIAPPPPNPPPDYGHREVSGGYVEVLGGLHQTNIVAAGTFFLRRVASTPVLDQ